MSGVVSLFRLSILGRYSYSEILIHSVICLFHLSFVTKYKKRLTEKKVLFSFSPP